LKRFLLLLLTGALLASACVAPAQIWFFNWDGTTDITCVPTIEGYNAFYQGSALRSSTNVAGPSASPTFYWEIVDNGSGGKAFRQVVTGDTGFRWYGYGSRPEYYRGPCTTFAMENLRPDRNAFTIAFRIKAGDCTSTGNVRFFNCEFETTVPNPFWPSGGAYEPYYTFRVEFALRKGTGNDIWLYDNRMGKDLFQLKASNAAAAWHSIWATFELPPTPYTTANCIYRLWVDGTEVSFDDRDRGGWSDCEVGWTPTDGRYATFSLDYLCYTYGAYQPGAIVIPTERVVAPTNSISALKAFPDGTPCELTNKVVTGISTDPRLGMKFYYVSEPNGLDGIKIRHNTGRSPQNTGGAAVTLVVGDIVSIKGGLSSAECEKQISACEIVRASTGAPIAAPATVSTADLVNSLNSALFASAPAQLLVVPETGVVSGLTGTNTMTDANKNWATNQWQNMTVFLPATGNHPDLYYYIIANTSDSLTTSHRTIRPDFNIAPDIVADGVRVGDGYEFVGGKPTGPRLDGRYLRTIGTVTAVNPTAGYFDINDGSALGEARTLQDIWDRINYGNLWTPPAGVRVNWNGTMPSVGTRLSVKGCAGAERFKQQVSTTINSSPRDEVKVDKVYPLLAADSFVPFTDPLITSAGLTTTGFVANVAVIVGEPYRIRASGDLQTWADVTNFVAASTNYLLVDPAAANQQQQYYRAVSP
jgi:hypothetical protein